MTDRQKRLDHAASIMPAGLRNSGLFAVAADPDVFFKTFGWHQWSKANNLTKAEKERFEQKYREAYEQDRTPGVKREELKRLIDSQ